MRRISAFLTSLVAGSAAVIGISASPASATTISPVPHSANAVQPAAVAAPAVDTPAAGTYRVVSQVRVLDSRAGIGGPEAAVPAGSIRAFHVTGVRGLPASGVSAVTVNVTVLTPARTGSVSVFPGGTAWTGTASISFGASRTTQRTLTAKLGANGTLAIRNNLAVGVQLVADVTGYFVAGTPTVDGSYASVPLTRVLDTRSGVGGSKSAIAPGTIRTFQVAGVGALPKTGVGAVAVNLSVLTPGQTGSISVFRGGSPWTGAVTASFVAGLTEQSMITAEVSFTGALSVRNNSRLPLQLVADVVGYYRVGNPTVRGAWGSANQRLMDTRPRPACSSCATLGARGLITANALTSGNQGPGVLRTGVAAIAVNISVLNATESGSVAIYPGTGGWNGQAPVTFHPGTSQSNFATALGIDGTFTVRNNSGHPIDVVVDLVGYFIGQPSPAMPGYDSAVTAGHGKVNAISCASATFCAAVADVGGYALRYDGSTWTEPTAVAGMGLLSAVSCATASFCVAIGHPAGSSAVAAVTYDGTAWRPPVQLPLGDSAARAISCPSASFCGAIDSTGSFLRYADGNWTTGPVMPGPTDATDVNLSCVSSSFCVGIKRGDNRAWLYDGTSWSGGAGVGSGGRAGTLSCVTASFCMAADYRGRVISYDGVRWSEPTAVPGASTLDALSCTSASFCMAAGGSAAFVFDRTSWRRTTAPTVNPARLLSCASATFCTMVDSIQPQRFSRYDGSTWAPAKVLDSLFGDLSSVSCASPSSCAAVGILGAAGHWNGSSWTDDGFVDPVNTLTAVSCPTTTFCAAVDNAGQAVAFDGASWSAPVRVDSDRELTGVSCGSATSCVAVDVDGYVIAYDGTRWSIPTQLARSPLSVSCPEARFCAAGDGDGHVLFYDGSSWTTVSSSPHGGTTQVGCASAGFCVVVDDQGTRRYDGGRWSDIPANDGQRLLRLSCPTAGYCVGTTGYGVIAYDGVSWSALKELEQPTGISCPTTTFCMAVNEWGHAIHS